MFEEVTMLRQPGRKKGVLLFLVLALAFILQNCGGGGATSSYDPPSTTATGAVITADTVKGWVDSGKVNGTGYDKVVILDLGSATNYGNGHIPGARSLNSANIYENRDEGAIEDVNMVLDGPTMDALIQKYGIDGNTTIVFTSADPTSTNIVPYWTVCRAYWTFRYWGFPKDRLKILNGLDAAYADTYGLTNAIPPFAVPSTYSVRQNPSFRGDLRASLADMINIADGKVPNTLVIDTRGQDGDGYDTKSSYSGDKDQTPGVWKPGTWVAFEGHINGAIALNSNFFFKTVTGNTQTYKVFLPASDMAALFTKAGLDSTKMAVVHCRTGVIASSGFAALDAVLGWPVENYDGSWSQWGMLASTANCGPLDPNSPWRTDTPQRTQNLTFNGTAPACTGIEDATNGGVYAVTSFDTDLNQMEEQDSAYFSGGAGGSGGGGGGNIGC
ncbi:MAG: selenite/tellurite reduction operon rhodanese-like protein ExtH [Nitrospiraceae bacterium]|nr:selenite/tellurite reduction operon rhodanese-like protein ExtH [Nitrospiraceae bacterium]